VQAIGLDVEALTPNHGQRTRVSRRRGCDSRKRREYGRSS
jgi:hypothetical protein